MIFNKKSGKKKSGKSENESARLNVSDILFLFYHPGGNDFKFFIFAKKKRQNLPISQILPLCSCFYYPHFYKNVYCRIYKKNHFSF